MKRLILISSILLSISSIKAIDVPLAVTTNGVIRAPSAFLAVNGLVVPTNTATAGQVAVMTSGSTAAYQTPSAGGGGGLSYLGANVTTGAFTGTVLVPNTVWAPPNEAEYLGDTEYHNLAGAGPCQYMTNSAAVTNLHIAVGGYSSPTQAVMKIFQLNTEPIAGIGWSSNFWSNPYCVFSNLITLPQWQGLTNTSIIDIPVSFNTVSNTWLAVIFVSATTNAHAVVVPEFTLSPENVTLPRVLMHFYNANTFGAGALLAGNGSPGYRLDGPGQILQVTNFVTYLTPYSGVTTSSFLPSCNWSLPMQLYATAGTEFNLYLENVVRSDYKPLLSYDVAVSVGAQYEGFYRIAPTNAVTTNLSITISAAFGTNLVSTFTGSIKCSADGAGSNVTRKLLIIGDSTTAGGQTITELVRIASTNCFKLTAIGTRGTYTNLHEGYSGWTFPFFYYGNGFGTSPFTNGSGAFDFSYYLTNNSITMASNDWVFINLGINDIFSYTSDVTVQSVAQTMLGTMSNMVESITAAVPGVRVGLCVIIPPSFSQDSFGVSYGTGQTLYRYKRNRYLLAETMCAYTQTNVYIVPINHGLDTVNNMNTITENVNSRNSNFWTHHSNGVHPASSGYLQIADQMWAFLKGQEN